MENFISKAFSQASSPVSSLDWKKKPEEERIKIINDKLKINNLYKDFEIISADNDAQVIIKIQKSIPASERGILLLDLESYLKASIEKAITVWLEPVGDKSKLRNLRGITFKKDEEI
tara:strand:- start:11913 stop:12263 length:351 start_codon:yes stop_codon:yes gene_type:complete